MMLANTGKKVELYQNANYGGWKAVLGEGEFRNLDSKVCDNDKLMCEVKPCNAKPNSLSSMKIPGGESSGRARVWRVRRGLWRVTRGLGFGCR